MVSILAKKNSRYVILCFSLLTVDAVVHQELKLCCFWLHIDFVLYEKGHSPDFPYKFNYYLLILPCFFLNLIVRNPQCYRLVYQYLNWNILSQNESCVYDPTCSIIRSEAQCMRGAGTSVLYCVCWFNTHQLVWYGYSWAQAGRNPTNEQILKICDFFLISNVIWYHLVMRVKENSSSRHAVPLLLIFRAEVGEIVVK